MTPALELAVGGMAFSGLAGGILLLCCGGLPDIDRNDYHGSMAARRIVARVILTWPLWGWFTIPLAFLGAAAWAVWSGVEGVLSVWRAAFPGKPPTDHDGPSQGGGYR